VLESVDEDFGHQEPAFTRRFERVAKDDPQAARFLIAPSLEGFSRAFRQGAQRWQGVLFRAPIQFFDTNFKSEESPDASSSMRALRDEGATFGYRRVPQPYREELTSTVGDDLFPIIRTSIGAGDQREKPVSFVVGPAGIGKSYLFSSIYAACYDEFIARKRQLRDGRRPIPLRAQSLQFEAGRSMKGILGAFLATEFARPLDEATLTWSLVH
jgi:hypothetical protein